MKPCLHDSVADDAGPASDPTAEELGRLWPLLASPMRAAVLTLARAAAGLPADDDLPEVLGMTHVTRILGVSRSTVDRRDAEGTIPAPMKLGRFKKWDRDDFRAWLRTRRPDGTTFTRGEWARLTKK